MIIIPDANNNYDHVVYRILKEVNSGDIPIVPITRTADFKFNHDLLKLGKYILVDMVEYDWNWDRKAVHYFGNNTHLFSEKFKGDEWAKFDDFVKNNHPVIYFKRELIEGKNNPYTTIYPIDWPCFHPVPAIESREEFNARPIEVFFSWGHSNEARRVLHGEIFINAAKKGYGVLDSPYTIERGLKEYKTIWATFQIPHYARLSMEQLLFIQGHSKLSISLPGAGVKCFRMAESSINSVMFMHDDGMIYSYPWIHGVNCIKSLPGKEIETIEEALRRDDLYDIYLCGVETVKRYELNTYVKNYIEPIINNHL
jgi:hypothetical protein